MKKLLLAIIAYSFSSATFAQTVKIFNTNVKIKDITVQNTLVHPNFASNSKKMDPALASNSINYWLGKMFTKNNYRQSGTFLDLGNDEAIYTFLDSIDMAYYAEYSLKNVLDSKHPKDAKYLAFRKAFKDAGTAKKRKELLINNLEYQEYFNELIESKIEDPKGDSFSNASQRARFKIKHKG